MSWFSNPVHFAGRDTHADLRPSPGSVDNDAVADDAEIARSKFALENLTKFPIDLTTARVWDAMHLGLSNTPLTDDDLAIIGTIAGVKITTNDVVGTSKTRKCAFISKVPESFQIGEDFQIRLRAGTIGDVCQVAATIDVECFEGNKFGGVGSDICSTAAQSINSVTAADKDFVIDETLLVPGSQLLIIVTIAANDTGGSGAVQAAFGAIERLVDIRG